MNELVAPRVQFLPKAASLNGALLPPTHPRHLLPPARPCLRRGPAHAQPRRPGPRTHPRPGRRTSRRGRCGGRAGLTSRCPRRVRGGCLGARGPRAHRGAAVRLLYPRFLAAATATSGRREGAFAGLELAPTPDPAPLSQCTPRPPLPLPLPSRDFLFLKLAPFISSNLPIAPHQLLRVPW